MTRFIPFFFLAIFCVLINPAFGQAPPNDGICSAVSITVGGGCVNGDNTNSTTEGMPTPSCWNGAPTMYSNSVWYSFVATDDSISINQGGAGTLGTQGLTAVYSSSNNTCGGTLTEVGCASNGNEAEVTGLIPGNTYFVMIDGRQTNVGTFCISAYETPPPPPPIGATCANPRDLNPGNDCNNVAGLQYDEQNNQIQTDAATGNDGGQNVTNPPYVPSGLDGTCTTDNDGLQNPYWVRFTATVTSGGGVFTRFTNQATCPQDYVVFSGSCGALTQVACFANVAAGAITANVPGLTAGQTYYVMITNSNGSTCTNRNLCLTSSTPYAPPYDACASALNVTAGTTYNLSNANSSADRNLCSGSMENNIWTVWTCPIGWTGPAYVHLFNQDCACGNGLQMSIYTASASCPPNANPTCEITVNPNNDNDFYGNFTPVPGSTYYITIDGYAGCSCVFDFLINGSPLLPVQLSTFSAVPAETGHLLEWATLREANAGQFEIEHSSVEGVFETLATVQATGNSNELQQYQYLNSNPGSGPHFYRLKTISISGEIQYSQVLALMNGALGFVIQSIAPVPAQEEATVQLQIPADAELEIQVTDLTGRLLLKRTLVLDKGTHSVLLNLEALSPGVHFLTVINRKTGEKRGMKFTR